MYFTYPLLFTVAFLGSKFVGLDKTVRAFQQIGQKVLRIRRKIPWAIGEKSVGELESRIATGYKFLPLPIQCLDQSLVSWYLLNLNGHSACLKIGLSLTPLRSHAWVEVEETILGDIAGLSDMKVVAQYSAWPKISKLAL